MWNRMLIVMTLMLAVIAGTCQTAASQDFNIIIDSPDSGKLEKCMKTAQLSLRGRVEGTVAGGGALYIVPIIYTDQYYKQPHQQLNFSGDSARWSSDARLGRPLDKGLLGKLSLFIVDEENLNKINREYQNGGANAPEEAFSWKDNALRDMEVTRCNKND